MKMTFTKQELYDSIRLGITRTSPHVITEADKVSNKKLFNQILPSLKPYVLLEKIESPGMLFEFIKSNNNQLIIITQDIFKLRKNYLEIIEGAIGSNMDTGQPWPIRYLNHPEFVFTGKMILLTSKTRKEISSNKRFEYFERDCLFV